MIDKVNSISKEKLEEIPKKSNCLDDFPKILDSPTVPKKNKQ